MIDLKREERKNKKVKVGAQAFVTFFTLSSPDAIDATNASPPLSLIQLSKSNI